MISADDFDTHNKSFTVALAKKHGWSYTEAVRYLVNYAQNRIETLQRDREKNGARRAKAAGKPAKPKVAKKAKKASKPRPPKHEKFKKPGPVAKTKRELTPQQREAKNKRDRDRRAAKKAPTSASEPEVAA